MCCTGYQVSDCLLVCRTVMYQLYFISFVFVFLHKHEDEALPLTCEFNHRGTHLAVGDESGRIDIWSLVPLRLYVKSIGLTAELLDALIPLPPFTENANGNALVEGSDAAKDKDREFQEHGWSTASLQWSRRVGCGRAGRGGGNFISFACTVIMLMVLTVSLLLKTGIAVCSHYHYSESPLLNMLMVMKMIFPPNTLINSKLCILF